MQIFPDGRRAITALIAASMLGAVTPATTGGRAMPSAKAPFLAANPQAMRVMMSGMAVTPSGDVDRDFTAMMIPHQGAIDMARAELRYRQNEQAPYRPGNHRLSTAGD